MLGMGNMSVAKAHFKLGEREISSFLLYGFVHTKDPFSTTFLRTPNEKQKKQLSDYTKVNFGVTVALWLAVAL